MTTTHHPPRHIMRNAVWLVFGILLLAATSYALTTITDARIDSPILNTSDTNYKVPRSADVVVCRGTSVLDDVYKMVTCDVVCKSTDNDCSGEINTAISDRLPGENVYLRGYNFTITNTIRAKESVTLIGQNGLEGGGGSWYAKNYTTRIKWNGVAGGTMYNATGFIGTFGLNSLLLDGNYVAGFGVYKKDTSDGDRARHLNIKDLTVTHINGSAFYLGNQVDDTVFNNVFIQEGGANSIGIASPNSMITYLGGIIQGQAIGVLYDAPSPTTGQSIHFYSTVFGGNTNDLVYNTTNSYANPISFHGCWIEPGSATHNNIVLVLRPTDIYGIDFIACNIGANSLGQSALNLSLSTKANVNFVGGRSYVPAISTIYGNENTTLSFSGHNQGENEYRISGIPFNKLSSDGLLAYLKFNGNALDSAGRFNNVTQNLGIGNVSAVYGRGYSFNGSAQVNVTGNMNTQNMTLSAWIYPTSLSGDNYVIARADVASYATDAYDLYTSGSNVRLILQNSSVAAGQSIFQSLETLQTNEWTHIVATVKGPKIILYINGRDAGCSVVTGPTSCSNFGGTINSATTALGIGAAINTGVNNGFDGYIDQVMIWDRALSNQEITTLYNLDQEM